MRPNEDLLSQIDEEDTNKDDTDSARYFFLEFFDKGLGQSTMRSYFQKSIEEVMKKKESDELFNEKLNNGNDLKSFLSELNRTNERAELEFDPLIWSTVARVFKMRNVKNIESDDIDSTEYSVKAGSPIQRVIIRRDQSERIEIGDIQDNSPSPFPKNDPSLENDGGNVEIQNPEDY